MKVDKRKELNRIVKNSITESLIKLMEEKRFKDISITELCARAGVSRISFYRNYKSKQDILVKKLIKEAEEWWKRYTEKNNIENDNNLSYFDIMSDLFTHFKKLERIILLLYKNSLSHLLKANVYNSCGPKPEHSDHNAYIRAMIAGSIFGLLDEWIKRGMKEAPHIKEMESFIRNLSLMIVD